MNTSNTPKVGDVIVALFGYEALISEFALVTKVTAKRVSIQKIGSNNVYTGGGGMYWTSTPNTSEFRGSIESKAWKLSGDSYRVNNNSYSSFYPWSGKPIECYNVH